MTAKKTAYLISLTDDGNWHRIKINDDLELGRHTDNKITARVNKEHDSLGTHDQSVSRNHAKIFWKDGKLFIQDIGSLNGTWVNGCRLPGWQKVKERSQRPCSNPLEIISPSTVFLGPYTGVSINFDGYTVPFTQGNAAPAPLDVTVDHPNFDCVYKQNRKAMVIPHFTGTMDIRTNALLLEDIDSKEDIPEEKRLHQCQVFIMGAIVAHHNDEADTFKASLLTVMDTLCSLEKYAKDLAVEAVMLEEETRRYHEPKIPENPKPYEESCERLVKKLNILKKRIDNITISEVQKTDDKKSCNNKKRRNP